MNEPYVSTQISVLKTDRRLIAFYDKLKTADVTRYAQLHADGEYYENNRKARSLEGALSNRVKASGLFQRNRRPYGFCICQRIS